MCDCLSMYKLYIRSKIVFSGKVSIAMAQSYSKTESEQGVDFTKGLKSRFRLKFKTLVLSLC